MIEKQLITEAEAAKKFVDEILPTGLQAWSKISQQLEPVDPYFLVLGKNKSAAFEFALALMSVQLRALDNLFPTNQAKRIEHHIFSLIQNPPKEVVISPLFKDGTPKMTIDKLGFHVDEEREPNMDIADYPKKSITLYRKVFDAAIQENEWINSGPALLLGMRLGLITKQQRYRPEIIKPLLHFLLEFSGAFWKECLNQYIVLPNEEFRRQQDVRIAQEKEQASPKPTYHATANQSRWNTEAEHARRSTQVMRIDGLSAYELHELQQRTASTIGTTAVFQDPTFVQESSSGFLGFGSGSKKVKCPEIVVIPAGKLMDFLEITQPFAIGRYAVTNAEYSKFCSLTNRKSPKESLLHPNYPVRFVSWWDACQYCDWLSSKTKEEYRLPTKMEWEYACRAGTRDRYWFGDEIALSNACFGFDYVVAAEIERLDPSAPTVGEFAPPRFHLSKYPDKPVDVKKYRSNPWGLFQMHGNVSEWVSDTGNPQARLACGGSFRSAEEDLTSSSYVELEPVTCSEDVGFRVARSVRE